MLCNLWNVFFSHDHHLGCYFSGLLYFSLLFGLLIVVCLVVFDFSFLLWLLNKLHLETFPNFIFEVYTSLSPNKRIWVLQFIPVNTLRFAFNKWVFVYRKRCQSGITLDYHSVEVTFRVHGALEMDADYLHCYFRILVLSGSRQASFNFSSSYLNSVSCVEQALISAFIKSAFFFSWDFFMVQWYSRYAGDRSVRLGVH